MDDSTIIDRLGGPTKVAALCEVTKSAVSQWRANGIPKAQRRFLRAVRPELFDPLALAKGGQQDITGGTQGPEAHTDTDGAAASQPPRGIPGRRRGDLGAAGEGVAAGPAQAVAGA